MKLILKNVRLSFPDLFTAVQYQGAGPFSYRCSLLVPSASATRKQIDAAILEVAKEKWAAKAEAVMKKAAAGKQGICFTDGDAKEYDGYADHWVLTATKSQDKGRPDIRDRDGKTPLTVEDGKPYAGCFVNAVLDLWAQDNQFGQSVRCTLVGLQFAKDGEAFSGGAVITDGDFEELGEDADGDMA